MFSRNDEQEAYQSENGQPRVVRPAHDEWGINKIIFVFCDDFLKRVYNFPWFQTQEWRELLDPYFEAAGVPADKVNKHKRSFSRTRMFVSFFHR